MSKKSKYIFGAILSLMILGGCKEKMPSLGEASSVETSSETVTETSAATTAVPAKEDRETSTVTSETTETTAERDEISEEQAALEKLILEAAEETENPYAVSSSMFGDFDNDGKNECILVVGDFDFLHSMPQSLWFASGDRAYRLIYYGNCFSPEIVTSCGNTFIKVERRVMYDPGMDIEIFSQYFLLKDSLVSEANGIPYGKNVYPYGEFGDFIAQQGGHGINTELDKTDMEASPVTTERTRKTYWYYSMDGRSYGYAGRKITEEEFLKYEGASAVLDKVNGDGMKIVSIIKRGCGIINVSLIKEDETEEYIFTSYYTKTLKYRNGKLFDVTENYDSGGNYRYKEDTEQTDFERFSEMIYDTAEGDENSFIRERFYGDTDKDGKNELYAYYGTDENFSLWFADDSGAKKVTEDIKLFYADGDVLMKNGDDYFVIKNGRQKKLDTMGAENFSLQEDGSFTGYISSGYADSTRSDVIRQLYWFRYKDGKISDYTGTDITEEELLQYGGGRAFLDEVAARGGDLVNIVRRENGIININYALHNQTTTKRFFMTLEIDADNKLTDITPKKEDGTPDNAGWYLHSLSIASAK